MKKPIVGIIGGSGRMGTRLNPLFSDFAEKILITSENTQEKNPTLAEESDVILIATPMNAMPSVLQEISPFLNEKKLLIDIGSLKKEPCLQMEKTSASIIGMHPLFGPGIPSFDKQTFVLCPIRPGQWLKWLEDVIKASDAMFIEMQPEEHDQMMAYMQSLVHFTNILFSDILLKHIDWKHYFPIATPVFQMQLLLAARVFSQSADLYADIQMENPFFSEVLSQFEDSFQDWKKLILSKNKEDFQRRYETSRKLYEKLLEKSQSITREFHQHIKEKIDIDDL